MFISFWYDIVLYMYMYMRNIGMYISCFVSHGRGHISFQLKPLGPLRRPTTPAHPQIIISLVAGTPPIKILATPLL